jgi:type I restriction enzyme S subunit
MANGLPEAWEIKRLGEVCQINPSRKEIASLPDNLEVSFVPMAAVSEDGQLLEVKTRKIGEVRKGFPHFKEEDVLIAKITPCFENGKRWLANSLTNGLGFGSTEFHVLRSNSYVLPAWIYYFISLPVFRKDGQRRMTGTAGQKRVPSSFLEAYKIPVPPIMVQDQIVKCLRKAEHLRESREQANEATNKIISSEFQKMFGGKKSQNTLGDVAIFVSSGSTPLGGENTYVQDGIAFIREQNVLMNELDLQTVAHLREEIHHRMRRTWVKNGDVLLNITGASLGRVAVYRGEDDKANVNQHVCIIRLDQKKAIPEYVSSYLSTAHAQKQIWTIQAGASRQALNFKQVKSLTFYLPAFEEQEKFVRFVNRIHSMKERQKHATEETGQLFLSLMQKAFRGELTVKRLPAEAVM